MREMKTHRVFFAATIIGLSFVSCNSAKNESSDKPAEAAEQIDQPAESQHTTLEKKGGHSEIANVSLEEYTKIVSSSSFVVVDMYTTWCRPCKEMAPHLKKIASEYDESEFKLVKIDAEKNVEMSNKLKIEGYPTLKLYKDGKEVNTTLGGMNEAQLRELFSKYM